MHRVYELILVRLLHNFVNINHIEIVSWFRSDDGIVVGDVLCIRKYLFQVEYPPFNLVFGILVYLYHHCFNQPVDCFGFSSIPCDLLVRRCEFLIFRFNAVDMLMLSFIVRHMRLLLIHWLLLYLDYLIRNMLFYFIFLLLLRWLKIDLLSLIWWSYSLWGRYYRVIWYILLLCISWFLSIPGWYEYWLG